MTRDQYILTILALYEIANNSDSEEPESWINKNAYAIHCQAYDTILQDLDYTGDFKKLRFKR